MKVIELLNKIANEEEVPSYIKYINYKTNDTDTMMVCKENIIYKLDQLEMHLNDEVEIIEDKKIPEKIECYHQYDEIIVKDKFYQDQQGSLVDEIIIDKLNEVLDYLQSKGE